MSSDLIFISYSRADKKFAEKIERKLISWNFKTWRDADGLVGTQHWTQTIDDTLRKASIFLLVMSSHSAKSQYVNYEIGFSKGAKVPILPITASKTSVPEQLKAIQFLDFRRRSGEWIDPKCWVRLMEALKRIVNNTPPSSSGALPSSLAEPEIHAAFRLYDGMPQRTGREFLITLEILPMPKNATTVEYEIHDDTFTDPIWRVINSRRNFETEMQSHGDVPLTARIYLKGKRQPILVRTTLLESLKRRHSGIVSPAVRKALKYISQH